MLILVIVSVLLCILIVYATVKAAVSSVIGGEGESKNERHQRLSLRLRNKGIIDDEELLLLEDSIRLAGAIEVLQGDYNECVELLKKLRDEKNLTAEEFHMKIVRLEDDYDMRSIVPYKVGTEEP